MLPTLVGTVFLTGLWLALTAVLFVWPRSHHPARADAVVVPSGDHGERLAAALRLIRRGVAPTLVLDGQPDFPLAITLCEDRQDFEVVCLRPDPDNTRGEARAAGRLATERRWQSVVLVTTSHHVTHAHLLFDRCVDGRVHGLPADPPYGWRMSLRQIPREWLGVMHALLVARSC